jgi:hypothetical protein
MRGFILRERSDDWYTDAAFAQQQFTGTNPTTITIASGAWISRFQLTALREGHNEIADLLQKDAGSFYVQDNSYFRAAMRLNADVELKSTPTQYERSLLTMYRMLNHFQGR